MSCTPARDETELEMRQHHAVLRIVALTLSAREEAPFLCVPEARYRPTRALSAASWVGAL